MRKIIVLDEANAAGKTFLAGVAERKTALGEKLSTKEKKALTWAKSNKESFEKHAGTDESRSAGKDLQTGEMRSKATAIARVGHKIATTPTESGSVADKRSTIGAGMVQGARDISGKLAGLDKNSPDFNAKRKELSKKLSDLSSRADANKHDVAVGDLTAAAAREEKGLHDNNKSYGYDQTARLKIKKEILSAHSKDEEKTKAENTVKRANQKTAASKEGLARSTGVSDDDL